MIIVLLVVLKILPSGLIPDPGHLQDLHPSQVQYERYKTFFLYVNQTEVLIVTDLLELFSIPPMLEAASSWTSDVTNLRVGMTKFQYRETEEMLIFPKIEALIAI